MSDDMSAKTAQPEPPPKPPHEHTDRWTAFVLRATTFITLVIKLGGVAIAGNEAFFTPSPHDPVAFGVAAFMMAGATGLDNLIGNALGGGKK